MINYTDTAFRVMHDGRIISKVVGVTYEPGYPESAFLLMKARAGGFVHPGRGTVDDPDGGPAYVLRRVTGPDAEELAAVLIRNPDNAADPSAIEVHVPLLECRVGFLPGKLAAALAPDIDAGDRYVCSIWAVKNLKSPQHPGVRISLKLARR